MEITEKEREMLEKERDEIKRLASEILELEKDPKNNTKIKQHIIYIQSSINRLASYSNPKNTNLDAYMKMADGVMPFLSGKPSEIVEKQLMKQINSPEMVEKLNKRGVMLPTNPEYSAWWTLVVSILDRYCCYVTSIRFDFTEKGLKIVLPKITLPKNLNFGNIINM